MPNIKITELPESTSIADDDLLVMVDSGNPYVTKKIAWKNIDAPQDDTTYGRKNGSWIDISSIEGNTFTVTNVDLHNGGIQSAQVLQFDDVTKQAVIIGPAPPLDSNAQRLIIQGHKASGTYAEGGDVYLWGGDSEYNGGDIKIYAGDADNVSPDNGYGGYVNIDGGRGTTSGGNVEITAGYSDEGQAGNVYIIGGSTSTGTAGNVAVRTNNNINNWTFDLNGNFLVPGNITLANNSTIASGTYDNGTGGNGGISLNCVVGYELNWQGGHLKNTYNNGDTNSNILCDSAIEFPGVDTDNVEINSTGIIFSDGTSQTSAGILDAPSDSITYGRRNGNWIDLYSTSNFQIRRGLESEVSGIIPLQGEPVWAIDTDKLVIGDGSTYGGIPINVVGYVPPLIRTDIPTVYGSGHYIHLDNIVLSGDYGEAFTQKTKGMVRGNYAVDLSLARTDASFFASGNYSFVGGGLDGQALGTNSASLCGGKTTEDYMLSLGSNKSSSPSWGDGTYCDRFLLSIAKKTTNNTITTLTGGASNYTLTMPTNTALFATAQIAAIEETSGSGVAHFYRKFTARRFFGSASVLDFSTIGTDYNPSGYTIPTGVGAAGGIVAIRVTGGASTTLRWICTIDGMMVSLS